MRSHNSTRAIPDRMASALVSPDSGLAQPRSTYFLSSSTRPGQHRNFVRRVQMPATLRDGIAEILADIDGLPVLLRILVKDAPAQFQSKDAEIHSLLCSTLEKMVDRMRGSSLPSDRPSQRLSIAELISGGEPLANLPALPNETVLRLGPLQLDLIDRTARRGERTIDLRPRESSCSST